MTHPTHESCDHCGHHHELRVEDLQVRYREDSKPLEATAWKRFTAGIHFIRSRPIIGARVAMSGPCC